MKILLASLRLSLLLAGCVGAEPDTDQDVTTDPVADPAEPGDGSSAAGVVGHDGGPVRILNVQYEVQATSYWCGPAATKMALSGRIAPPSQQTLANQLGTTPNGTDWIGQITNVMNQNLGAKWYVTRELPNHPPSPTQRGQLWNDVVRAIDNGFPFVANIVAPPSNHPPGYPNRTVYHYFAVIGYNRDTQQVYIADSANFSGTTLYWLPFNQLATLIPPKGYTALAACTREVVVGEIANKYDALGGCTSVIGTPITAERATPDGVGRFTVFERGSIYWTPTAGSHEVHGRIRDRWAAEGWEAGRLGYPISDEYVVSDGRRSDFERGSIHWSAATGETTVGP